MIPWSNQSFPSKSGTLQLWNIVEPSISYGFSYGFLHFPMAFHRFQADFDPNFPGETGLTARPPSVAHRPLEHADFAGTRNGRVAGGLGGCFRGSEEWLINGNLVGEIDIYLIKRDIYLINL